MWGVWLEGLLPLTQAISAALLAPTLALDEDRTTKLEAKGSCLQAQLGLHSETP